MVQVLTKSEEEVKRGEAKEESELAADRDPFWRQRQEAGHNEDRLREKRKAVQDGTIDAQGNKIAVESERADMPSSAKTNAAQAPAEAHVPATSNHSDSVLTNEKKKPVSPLKDEMPQASAGLPHSAREGVALADYCLPVPEVGPMLNCLEALAVFRSHPDAPCLVVTDVSGAPEGLLMRDAFHRKLSGRFAAELFYSRPALHFADMEALTAEIDELPSEVIGRALSRSESQFYDCIVLKRGGRLKGVLTVRDLMRLSGRLQERAEEERRLTVEGSCAHVGSMESALQEAASAAETARLECVHMERWIETGSGKMDHVHTSYLRVEERIAEQRDQVAKLLEHVSEIASLTGEIGGIAETSELLALNASIEAAHAGDHGRGFQVVASEVRSLSHHTRRLTESISSLLAGIGGLARRTAELTGAASGDIAGGAGEVTAAKSLFQNLRTAVEAVEQADETACRLARQSADRAQEVKSRLLAMGDFTQR
ncbi:chemotaxis protein [Paenibacillus sp. HN-1]|uniref:methyl-accepting chemotaxis protein n=1 Tax=Paenibacillus TaxID=44249 RepID=UPI001CA8F0CA|nr:MULTISPECIES: methyl-accepting chemotaxis protein [Paenibacillus]MBY9080328.1 chemotaxis protein [Paenibacillus sp. CGMCC 1.18879]MBY9083013.1 chemotaxis protein [Paenibacillus sinensis]